MLLRWPSPSSNAGPGACAGRLEQRGSSPVDIRVGFRVRQKRVECGLSQSQMSARLGVSEQLLSDYESGRTRIDAKVLVAISQLTGERPSYFFAVGPVEWPKGETAAQSPAATAADDAAEGLELMRAFARIKDPEAGRKILDFAAGLAHAESASQ